MTNPALLDQIHSALEDSKAIDVIDIDLDGKSTIADRMVIASGRSNRHLSSIAQNLRKNLKNQGVGPISIDGLKSCDWILVDIGDVIVHLFHPDKRNFYQLEKIWAL